MGKSYIGIVSRDGLLALCPEEASTASRIVRRFSRRQRASTAYYWAVLDDEAAGDVVRCLRSGESQAALATLSGRSEHLGTLLPLPEEGPAARKM